MRIMLDTNIIISAALFPNGRASSAFYKALMQPYQPIVCDYVVDELHRKFREKFPDKLTELEALPSQPLKVKVTFSLVLVKKVSKSSRVIAVL